MNWVSSKGLIRAWAGQITSDVLKRIGVEEEIRDCLKMIEARFTAKNMERVMV